MKALLSFWLDNSRFNLTPELRAELDQMSSGSCTSQFKWLKENAARFGGLPDCVGFLEWDRRRQSFYIEEGNGKKFDFGPNGFPMPDFVPDPKDFPVSEIEAVVYFFPVSEMVLGCNFERPTQGGDVVPEGCNAVLDREPCENTAFGRCILRVSGVPDLAELSAFVARVRSGLSLPSTTWK